MKPRLEGWCEGHTTIAWDPELEREAPVDTRRFLIGEAEEALKNSRTELNSWIDLEKNSPETFTPPVGGSVLPGYWWMAYSAGYPIEDLSKSIDEYLDQSEKMNVIYRARYPRLPHNFIQDIGSTDYWRVLTNLGWLVGFNATREQLARYLALTGEPGQDALFDRIVVTLGFPRPVSETLILERSYKDTLAVLDDPPSKQAARLARILKSWLRSRLSEYGPIKPGEPRYAGYWATDVALLVMVLKLDDSTFREAQHYPADLVDYHRAHAGH